MKNRRWLIPFAMLLAILFAGCQRRPLENMYSATVKVIVKCIWKVKAYPEKPTGVTLYFFRDGEVSPRIVTTSDVDSCEVQLPAGHYKLFMITQSPEEYWTMRFMNMNKYREAEVELEQKTTKWFTRIGDEEVAQNPESIAVGIAEEFDITEDQVEEYQEFYQLWRTKTKAMTKTKTKGSMPTKSDEEELREIEERVRYTTITIPVDPHNIVSQFHVTIYSDNADVLMSVRAATTGMARTFELTQNTTGRETATQLIEQDWTLTMDDEARRIGHLDGIITTFGLPNGEVPTAVRDSSLNVSALLIDNKTQEDYVFSVGDKIQILEPNPGYRHLYRLIFGSVENPAIHPPDVAPANGLGGFDVTVDAWEEGETVEIPM